MAPMVAQSDLPFRKLCRNHGTQLCFTQMIHASNFVSSESFQDSQLDVYKLGQEIVLSPSGVNALRGLGLGLDQDQLQNHQHRRNDAFQHLPFDQLKSYHEHVNNGNDDCTNTDDINENDCTYTWNRYYEGPSLSSTSSTTTSTENDHHPLIVQLAGHDPHVVTRAAMIILERTGSIDHNNQYTGPVSGIDINCGCPQGIARKGRYGAFLMEENVDLVCDIIRNLRSNLPPNVGVSCKMRIPQGVIGSPKGNGNDNSNNGNDNSNNGNGDDIESNGDAILKQRIHKLIDAGVELLTIHGRNIKENKTKVGQCNWDAIAQVVQVARSYSSNDDFPIIANGGIEFPSDIQRCLDYTGASAIMSSEALLEHPGIFATTGHDHGHVKDDIDPSTSPQDIFQRQLMYCHEYLDYCILYPPVPGSLGKQGGSFNCIRSHLFKLLYRYLEEQPDIRSEMGHATQMTCIHDARNLLKELEGRYHNVLNDDQEDEEEEEGWKNLSSSNVLKSSWYRRHRDAKHSNKMRTRGQSVTSELTDLTPEEKKRLLRERIKKLKEKRQSNKSLV